MRLSQVADRVAVRLWRMRLFELADCCRLYGEVTGYDASIDEVRRATLGEVDLRDPGHTKACCSAG